MAFEIRAQLPHTLAMLSRAPQFIDYEFDVVRCSRVA
jgi:hypothetical protein